MRGDPRRPVDSPGGLRPSEGRRDDCNGAGGYSAGSRWPCCTPRRHVSTGRWPPERLYSSPDRGPRAFCGTGCRDPRLVLRRAGSRSRRGPWNRNSGYDLIPVGTEGQASHSRGVSEEGEDVLTALHVPELDGPVVAGRREAAAVRAEREGVNPGRMPGQGVDQSGRSSLRGRMTALSEYSLLRDRRLGDVVAIASCAISLPSGLVADAGVWAATSPAQIPGAAFRLVAPLSEGVDFACEWIPALCRTWLRPPGLPVSDRTRSPSRRKAKRVTARCVLDHDGTARPAGPRTGWNHPCFPCRLHGHRAGRRPPRRSRHGRETSTPPAGRNLPEPDAPVLARRDEVCGCRG